MAAVQETLDRAINSIVAAAEGLHLAAQGIGTTILVLILLIPVLVTLLTRIPVLFVAALMLLLLTLSALGAPSSIASVLALLSAISLFLVAAAAFLQKHRQSTVEQQLADLEARMDQLESAESRRTLIEMKKRTQADDVEATPQKDSVEAIGTPKA